MTRHLMTSGFAIAAAIGCLFLVAPASNAQIVAAIEDTSPHFPAISFLADATFDDINAAVADAISRANSSGRHYEVWVVERTGGTSWTTSTGIKLDANSDVSLRGFPFDDPFDVTISASGIPVIELDNTEDDTIIEGLTLTGGSAGVLAVNGAEASINRCYIRNNSDGVRTDASSVILINCSIVDSAQSGVELGGSGSATVLFCSIIDNNLNGIFTTLGSSVTAQVTNTLVYRNGTTTDPFAGGIVKSGVGSIALDTNDVFANGLLGAFNYVGLLAGPQDISADPLLLTAGVVWKGEIDSSQDPPSPLIDVGSTAYGNFGGLSATDFDSQIRTFDFILPTPAQTNVGPIPDIGADEVGAEAAFQVQWYYCLVTPSPFGKAAAGDVQVEIRLTPPSLFNNPGDAEVFIVPQGGDANSAADRIALTTRVSSGGIWVGTNASAIDTVLNDTPPTGISGGDLIADGHAAVYIQTASDLLGDDYTPPYSEGGLIVGQALIGRHVLIDTIQPKMTITGPTGDGAATFLTLFNPAPYGSQAAFSNGFVHPYSNVLPVGYRPDSMTFAVDDGLVLPNPTLNGNGAQAFFNSGSISNNYPRPIAPLPGDNAPNPLDVDIHVRFEDFPPRVENTTTDVLGVDPFLGTSLRPRQVAGFPVTMTGVVNPEDIDEVLLRGPIVRWLFSEGQNRLSGVTVKDNYVNPAISNVGFDYTLANGSTFDPANKAIDVSWRFYDSTGTILGIPYANGLNFAPFHFATRFYAKDPTQPDDALPPDPTTLLDPLHVWWLLESNTLISPPREGATTSQPLFTWQMDRAVSTRSAGQLKPLYAFRVWQSSLPGNDATAYNAPYTPVTAWSAWSDTISIVTPVFFENLVNGAALAPGRWVLIAVAGADEAGNIEAFPTPDAQNNGSILTTAELELDNPAAQNVVNFLQPSGRSWQRFFYPGPGSQLETQAVGVYWHDSVPFNNIPDATEVNFGSAAIVPLPTDADEQVSARFRVAMSSSNPLDIPIAGIVWSLKGSNGFDSGDSAFIAGGGSSIIDVPIGGPLGDVTNIPAKPVTYVFSATMFAGPSHDQTPATVTFTVVPRSVGAFVDPKDSPDDQPIKIQESL
jgi:hypothetical protein